MSNKVSLGRVGTLLLSSQGTKFASESHIFLSSKKHESFFHIYLASDLREGGIEGFSHGQQYRRILLFHFNLKCGDMGVSKKGRLKYSESDSVFVYLAKKGDSFDNFENLIFSPISQTLYHPGKNSRKKYKIFLHTCVEER